MLFGTSLLFRIAYFFTSFFPALFLLSLNFRNEVEFYTQYEHLNEIFSLLMYWMYPILTLCFSVFAAKYILGYLIKRQNDKRFESNNCALNFNVKPKRFKDGLGHMIDVHAGTKINSGFIAFAISVVAPSVVLTLINDGQMLPSLLVIFMFFLLMMMSNDVFPNIVLPLFGVNLMVTQSGYNVFYLSKQGDILSGVKRLHTLGNAGSLSKTYILSNDSLDDTRMEDE